MYVNKVDGVLMPPNGPDCWPKTDSNKQWIVFYQLDDMTFTGTGTIEGNGEKWWELPCKPHRVFFSFSICVMLLTYKNFIFYVLFSWAKSS